MKTATDSGHVRFGSVSPFPQSHVTDRINRQESVAGVLCKISLECQVQTGSGSTTIETACSEPDTESCGLVVGNVVMTSRTPAPTAEQDQSLQLAFRKPFQIGR